MALKAEVKRDGRFLGIPTAEVVPGDIVRVRIGDVVPTDALVLEVSSFTANEAALTGAPYPVEKRPGLTASSSPAEATNALFRGSIAQTGEATALAVATGRKTLFGAVASVLAEDIAPSPFQRDLRALGFVVARAAGVLSVGVLAINLLFGRPIIQSLMFAVALAVGRRAGQKPGPCRIQKREPGLSRRELSRYGRRHGEIEADKSRRVVQQRLARQNVHQ